jgi:hypothetical protein
MGLVFQKLEKNSMAVSNEILLHFLMGWQMSNTDFIQKAGFSSNLMTPFKRGKQISSDCIKRILFARGAADILEFTDPGNQKKQHKLASMIELKALLWRPES